jgi:hypothetical protein
MMLSKASGWGIAPRPFLISIWTLSPGSIGLQEKEGPVHHLASVCSSFRSSSYLSSSITIPRREVLFLVYEECHQEARNLGAGGNAPSLSAIDSVPKIG